jgi:hypothetical protein
MSAKKVFDNRTKSASAQPDFIAGLNVQDGFRRIVFDRLVRSHHAVLLQDGIAQQPHLVERVAVFPFKAPGPMNEKTIQDQDEIVEEKRFKRSGGRAGLRFVSGIFSRRFYQTSIRGQLRFDLRTAGAHIVFRIGGYAKHRIGLRFVGPGR